MSDTEHPEKTEPSGPGPYPGLEPPVADAFVTAILPVQPEFTFLVPSRPGRVYCHVPDLSETPDSIGSGGMQAPYRLQPFRYSNAAFARHLCTTINKYEPKRDCMSLPLYLNKSDLGSLVPRPGMEYVPLRTPAAETYHYHHVTDQTKSLQDLQNEVAALLEFRNLVIETFPDLKTKMASSAANSTLTGLPSSSSLGSRREWEPGIRIRRKLTQKDATGGSVSVGCSDVGASITGAVASSGSTTTTIIPGTSGSTSTAVIHAAGNPVTSAPGSSTASSSNSSASNANATELGHHHAHHHHLHHTQHGGSGSSSNPHQQQHSSSSLIRSRSNSHSGKKEPKSGEGNNGSVIQDSGFSTETSSSKETHSAASSTSGAVQGTLILPTTTNRLAAETGGELWNLLDVIHRKSSQRREEVEQHLEQVKSRGTNLVINQHAAGHHHHHPVATVGSIPTSAGGTVHHHHHLAGNNIIIHHSNPAPSAATSATPAAATAVATPSSTSRSTVVMSTRSHAGRHLPVEQQPQPQAPGGGRSGSGALDDSKDYNVQILRKERDRLLDKLSEYEAETIAGRINASKMQDELELLTLTMNDLQKQLKMANSQKLELNSKLNDLHLQTVNRSGPSSPESIKLRQQPSASQQPQTSQHPLKAAGRYRGKPSGVTQEDVDIPGCDACPATGDMSTLGANVAGGTRLSEPGTLGRLDAVFSSVRLQKVRSLDSKKITAILLETNILELQRHLLMVTVQNQILQQRLEQATRSRLFLSEKFEKSKEDLDDLRFQLKEKSIELEGTMAQLRVIESKVLSKSSPSSANGSPERVVDGRSQSPTAILQSHGHLHHNHQLLALRPDVVVPVGASGQQLTMRLQSSQVSTPSMKAMTLVAMDDIAQQQQHSSSTESTQDQAERDCSIGVGRLHHLQQLQAQNPHQQHPSETPRLRPSKIPLPGTKGSVAPKPPTGRNFSAATTPTTPTGPAQRSAGGSSGPPSNRSLTRSTGSLYVKPAEPSTQPPPVALVKPRETSTSSGNLYRPDSSQSWRISKDTPSLEKLRSSSIPASSLKMASPGTKISTLMPPPPVPPLHGPSVRSPAVCASPQPRAKRDNLTSKMKNCDSLSRSPSAQTSLGSPVTVAAGGQLGKGGSKREPAGTPPSTVGYATGTERKASIGMGTTGTGVLRHASNASIGSNGAQSDESTAPAVSGTGTTGSNAKVRRNNTFRLVKPTLMPLTTLDHYHHPVEGGRLPSPLPGIPPSPDTYGFSLRAVGRVRSQTSAGSTVTSRTESSQTQTPVVRSANSTSALCEQPRDLIGTYLAAKSRESFLQQQQPQQSIPPPIFHVSAQRQHQTETIGQRQIEELAYKHPILLMDEGEDVHGGQKRDDKDDGMQTNVSQESLIVPRPSKAIAFQSLHGTSDGSGCVQLSAEAIESNGKVGRLIRKLDLNLLNTWEQLSGGRLNSCVHQQQREQTNTESLHGSSIESCGDRQSCLLYCPQQSQHLGGEVTEYPVNRAKPHTDEETRSNTGTAVTIESTSDWADFYDSIDAVSTSIRDPNQRATGKVGKTKKVPVDGMDKDYWSEFCGGRSLSDVTSLERTEMLFSSKRKWL